MLKKHFFTIISLLLITTLSLMPAKEFPQVDVQFADKWAHWVMYAFLMLVISGEYYYRHNSGSVGRMILFFILTSSYGALMELGQAYLTTSRHGDWLDVAANTFGALCGLVISLFTLSLFLKFSNDKK